MSPTGFLVEAEVDYLGRWRFQVLTVDGIELLTGLIAKAALLSRIRFTRFHPTLTLAVTDRGELVDLLVGQAQVVGFTPQAPISTIQAVEQLLAPVPELPTPEPISA
jgi:hypothetical protein